MSEPQFDLKAAAKKFTQEMELTEDVYMSIVRSAIDPTKEDFIKLNEAIKAQDWETLYSIAHRFKGTYGNLRLESLAKIAVQMNDVARQKTDMEGYQNLLSQFVSQFEQLCQRLNQ